MIPNLSRSEEFLLLDPLWGMATPYKPQCVSDGAFDRQDLWYF